MEKHLTVNSAQIVGTSQEGVWAHTYSFEPPLPEQAHSQGTLYVVIDVSSGYQVDLSLVGGEVLSRLEKEYYGSVERGILASLEAAVLRAYEGLVSYGAGGGKAGLEFNLIAAVTWGPVIYFAHIGEGKVSLFRDGHLSVLLGNGVRGEVESGADIAVPSISGPMQSGDVYILGSPRFFTLVSEDAITQTLLKQGMRDSVDALIPLVYGIPDSGNACAIFLGPLEEDVPSEEDEFVIVEPEKPEATPLIKQEEEVSVLNFNASHPTEPSPNEPVIQTNKPTTQSFFTKLQNFLSRFIPHRNQKELVRLRTNSSRIPRKIIIGAVIILVFVLGFVIYSSSQKRAVDDRATQFGSLYANAVIEFDQAKALVESNIPDAKEQLFNVKKKLEEAKKLHYDDKKVDALLVQVEEELKKSSREFTLENVDEFMKLSLIRQGAQASKVSVFENKLGIFDSSVHSFYRIDLTSKAQSIIAGGTDVLGGATFTSLYSDFVYAFNKDKGIIQYDTKAKSAKTVVAKDPVWGEIVDMTFYSGRIYLLDRTNNQIWIHQSGENGFGPAQAWLAQGTKADFSNATGFAIDGSIWVLYSNGDIDKFLRGNKETFLIGELGQPLTNPRLIYTAEDDVVKHLYVVDGGQKRIVVISKDGGRYFAQYSGDLVGDVVGIVANEKDKKIFIITPTTIYSTNLR